MDRRTVLKMAAAATALAVGKRGVTQSREEQIKPVQSDQGYRYRVAFGAWINDMRNEPLPL